MKLATQNFFYSIRCDSFNGRVMEDIYLRVIPAMMKHVLSNLEKKNSV